MGSQGSDFSENTDGLARRKGPPAALRIPVVDGVKLPPAPVMRPKASLPAYEIDRVDVETSRSDGTWWGWCCFGRVRRVTRISLLVIVCVHITGFDFQFVSPLLGFICVRLLASILLALT